MLSYLSRRRTICGEGRKHQRRYPVGKARPMSDMHTLFVDPAHTRAVRGGQSVSGAGPRSGKGVISTVPLRAKPTGKLRALLDMQIAKTDHLRGLLCSLNLPILHLFPDLRLHSFSPAAAQLFGLDTADLDRWLDFRWPTAPRQVMAEVCRTGAPCRNNAKAPDGKDWQCHIVPHAAHDGVLAGVMVILLAQSETDPADPPPAQDKTDLTPRQRQVMELVLAGHPSKNIAAHLKISPRTVENHRAAIMQRTGATSLPALARIAVGAAGCADRLPRHGLRTVPDLQARLKPHLSTHGCKELVRPVRPDDDRMQIEAFE